MGEVGQGGDVAKGGRRASRRGKLPWRFLFTSIMAYIIAWICADITGMSFALLWIIIMIMAIIDGLVWHGMGRKSARNFYAGYLYGRYKDDDGD
jgi:Na+-driven multidrug efflux pump